MAGRQESFEVIAAKLHQIEMLQEQGRPVSEAICEAGITEPTYYRWHRWYGGMSQNEIRWMKQLMDESCWLGTTRH